jgi:hypothetical protein
MKHEVLSLRWNIGTLGVSVRGACARHTNVLLRMIFVIFS